MTLDNSCFRHYTRVGHSIFIVYSYYYLVCLLQRREHTAHSVEACSFHSQHEGGCCSTESRWQIRVSRERANSCNLHNVMYMYKYVTASIYIHVYVCTVMCYFVYTFAYINNKDISYLRTVHSVPIDFRLKLPEKVTLELVDIFNV